MKTLALSVAVVLASAGTAMACPDWTQPGVQTFSTTGQDLYSANGYTVTAGGNVDLAACAVPGTGYVISQPDFEFSLSGMAQYNRLNIRVNANGCDTVLLVNDAAGNWHFNDDMSGFNPSLDINSADGVYDIWVGTYSNSNCSAVLTLETF